MNSFAIAISVICILTGIFLELKREYQKCNENDSIWSNFMESFLNMVFFFSVIWFCFWVIRTPAPATWAFFMTGIAWLITNIKKYYRKQTA